jgi:hypothetical protein
VGCDVHRLSCANTRRHGSRFGDVDWQRLPDVAHQPSSAVELVENDRQLITQRAPRMTLLSGTSPVAASLER